MSYELATPESLPSRGAARRVSGRAQYPGLGATGVLAMVRQNVQTIQAAAAPVATAPWMQGLPAAKDNNDKTRIAYAKRDHDLALGGNAQAYANLKSQSTGSATAVGKAWYRAALADVDAHRAPAPVVNRPTTLTPLDPLHNPAQPPDGSYGWVWDAVGKVWIKRPSNVVYPTIPIVQQATDMGLKIRPTSDGQVVATNADGAVVSKPLPVPVSAVTDSTVVPPNAVQANAPPAPPTNREKGIFSIFDKLTDALTSSSSSGGSSFIPSQGPPPEAGTPSSSGMVTADMAGGVSFGGNLLQNPIVLIGGVIMALLLFSSSSGRRR